MFDIAKEVEIPQKQQMWYVIGRISVYALFLVFLGYAFVKVVFPSHYSYFDFGQYHARGNTLIEPRLENGDITRGPVKAGQSLVFNTVARGEFQKVEWLVRKTRESQALDGTLEMKRSYRAMLYPEGEPVIFREGTLLFYDGKYYIISQKTIRNIPENLLAPLRFTSPEQFMEIAEEEFVLHTLGEPVEADEYWIEGGLYRRDDEVYQLRGGELYRFISEDAFRSWYRDEDARETDEAVGDLETMKSIGFAPGVLIEYKNGVYAIEGEFIRPIDSPESFLSKGYDWEDIIRVESEEFSAYTQGDIYTLQRPHINGTVFYDEEKEEYYLVDNQTRRPIRGEHIQSQYKNIPEISVNFDSSLVECQLEKKFNRKYQCIIDIAGVGSGAEYQFTFTPSQDVILEEMDLILIRGINTESLGIFLTDVKNRLVKRLGIYGQE
jgi:hypothetical protein